MPLRLLPLNLADFDTMVNDARSRPPQDDLVGPPTPVCWPVSTPEEALARLAFQMGKQRARYLNDKTCRFLKVVDDVPGINDGEIVSIARWHWYPNGYSYADERHWEVEDSPPKGGWHQAMNMKLHDFILSERDSARDVWMARGRPCWILMHMVTRPSQRNRGAAGMIINWGLQEAERTAAPAYLEAGAAGAPIYLKYGFKQVGDLISLDLRPYGMDYDFTLARMIYIPKRQPAGLAAPTPSQ